VHGFHRAKELAIAYRTRLEKEWEEAEAGWAKIDADRQTRKENAEKEKLLIAQLEEQQRSQSSSTSVIP
jgi:hypothetical protein